MWCSIKRIFVLLVLGYLQSAYGLQTPLGQINNSATVRQPSGSRAAEITFSLSDSAHQAILMRVQPVRDDARTVTLPFQLLSEIQGHNTNLQQGAAMLIPHIPAAIATLTLVQSHNLPQFNQHLSVQSFLFVDGIIYLTLAGQNHSDQPVSTRISISLHLPGQIQVSLAASFVPVNLIIDMMPQQPDVPPQPPDLAAIMNILNTIHLPDIIQISRDTSPETDQMETMIGF